MTFPLRRMAFETLIDFPLVLGESPVWDPERGALWFVDISAHRIFRLDPQTGRHASFSMPDEVASLGIADRGRLVVALRTGVYLFDAASGALEHLVELEPDSGPVRLNDGRVGPDGNFWVGSMDTRAVREPLGTLYRVSPSGRSKRIAHGLRVSNGLAWSPDALRMYHADSRSSYVQSFEFDPIMGEATGAVHFATLSEAQGLPDGAAVDRDGYYWSAGVTAGVLNRISPAGELVESIALPVAAPTMLCFGGADMRTVFVTSLASDRSGQMQDGTLISFKVETPGLPGNVFGKPYGSQRA